MKKTSLCSVFCVMSMATAAFAADTKPAASPMASPMASPAKAGDMKPAASPMASPAKAGDMKPAASPMASPMASPEKSGDMKSSEGAMTMPKPGAEQKKLASFFSKGGTWNGKVPAGAMGPESKEMTSKGKATCKEMYSGMAYSCDVQDTMGKMTWMGHMVTGWDMASKSYKSVMADNMGTLTMWTGTMSEDGKKFSLESDKEMQMGNSPMFKDRLTWDMTSGKMMFTDEHGINGQWQTFETAEMKVTGAPAAATSDKKNMSGKDKPAAGGETDGMKK